MKVYVFGLGHIGLPMAIWIGINGYEVIGVDKNKKVIEDIENEKVSIHEYYKDTHISKLAKDMVHKKKLSVYTNYNRDTKEPSVFVITVGIKELKDGSQDISPILQLLDTILPTLVEGDLLLFRTTMIPGICEKIVIPRLKKLDKNVYLAYAPETIIETCAFEELRKNPIILAGMNDESYKVAKKFLSSISNGEIYKAKNIKTAEMAKVIQNIHRDVEIAFVNEVSEIAYVLGVDIYELKELINTHPRVKLLDPGPGVGGYCLPNALKYLNYALEDSDGSPILMETARNLNNNRPKKVIEMIEKVLKDRKKSIKKSRIVIMGLSMKDYCADCRKSPAIDIAMNLINQGANVLAYDPVVPMIYPFQVNSFEEAMKNADCLVITAKQKTIKYDIDKIFMSAKSDLVIVDTRNVFKNKDDSRIYFI